MQTDINMLKRQYRTTDSKMLVFAAVIHGHLEEYLADFAAFDADFTQQYVDDYAALIEQARNFDTDNQLIDVMAQATVEMKRQMKICGLFFQQMKFFVVKAFGNNAGMLVEFGFKDFNKAMRSPERLSQFMFDLHDTATRHQTTLVNAGFSVAKIAEILTLANDLKGVKTMQTASKGTRVSSTNERRKLYNQVYATITFVCTAGKHIYHDNYGRFQMFLLPW